MITFFKHWIYGGWVWVFFLLRPIISKVYLTKENCLYLDYCVSCEEETIYRGADLEMNEETIYRGADLEVEEETIYRGADLEMNEETIYRGADLDRDEEEHDMDSNFPERNGDISGKLYT